MAFTGELVFKALADASRRRLLDALNRRNGQSLRELCGDLDMTRQAVAKHLDVLEAARLVTTKRRGREKLHYLNAAPINEIADRWMSRYDRGRAIALADLKEALEEKTMTTNLANNEFVYVTYIHTTPEELWRALTEPAFTVRYWGAELKSDWKVGSPVLWREEQFWGEFRDLGQVVLESEPHRKLSYSWHNYQPEFKEMFGWTDERFAELTAEKRSKVTFEIEPEGPVVKLTVTHDGFEPGSEMLRAISGGWPGILANLKTLLETGEPLPVAEQTTDRETQTV